MKNFIQRGDMITVTAPTGGVTSGQGVLVGNLFGVAANTAAEGESVEIATIGVYELPKLASAVIAAGARVAWDDTAKQVVLPAHGHGADRDRNGRRGKWRHHRSRQVGWRGDGSGIVEFWPANDQRTWLPSVSHPCRTELPAILVTLWNCVVSCCVPLQHGFKKANGAKSLT